MSEEQVYCNHSVTTSKTTMQMSVFSLNVEVNLLARLSCDTATLVLVQAELHLLFACSDIEMCAYPLAVK